MLGYITLHDNEFSDVVDDFLSLSIIYLFISVMVLILKKHETAQEGEQTENTSCFGSERKSKLASL